MRSLPATDLSPSLPPRPLAPPLLLPSPPADEGDSSGGVGGGGDGGGLGCRPGPASEEEAAFEEELAEVEE